ncbi:MAG: hypothetical protein H6589_09070, partial [Flavobacteriales bacterium]|nr:hypothetical protein [Flavobacteriales bacterium]
MKRFYKKIFLGITMISLFILTSKVYGQGATCAAADPFCTGTSYSFPNSTGTTAPGGNNYGCLSTQPNPAWYYMQIGTSGNIDITISQVTNSGAGIDVDFIMYGPYNSLPIALADCGNMGNPSSEIEDCSYSTASTEVANIVGGVSGQYYMLLITNYSNISGNISFSQTGGTGSTNCAIINPPCPTVGIHAESGGTSYNFPLTFSCTDAGTLFIRADDAATAGGPIVPGIQVTTTTNSQTSGNNIYGLEQNGTTWNNYWSFTNLSASTNHTLSMYEVDNVTTNSLGVEFCDVRSGSDMSFVITDLNCGGVIANSPAWGAADGTNSGSAGSTVNGDVGAATPSGGCQVVTFPKTAVKGTATYSCPTCPPGSFTGTNYGHAFFSPSIAGPGTYNITYSFNNGCAGPDNCFGTVTETITVTSPNTFTSLTYPTPRCVGSGNASPTLVATGGGSYSSGTLGGALNTSTGVINTATAPVGTHTITYTVGTGTCSASGTGTITISPNNTVSAASSSPNVCVNTAITNITHTTTGATGIGAASGLPAGVTAGWSGNTITISGTPSAVGTFNYSIPLTGGCGTVNATGTITVRANNTVSAASASPNVCINTAITNISHTTTGATGIGAATGLPAGVTANW